MSYVNDENHLQWFGKADIKIPSNWKENQSTCQFGTSFQTNLNEKVNPNNWFAGSDTFQVVAIEVYQIIPK